ncbi:MAG: acetyltransferase [Gammaproteobacteria bacterium]|nr:acetyltransferase [Gammaproteobacteria bacterium]
MPTEILIIGSGGHARVVAEAVLSMNASISIVVVDEDVDKQGADFLGRIRVASLDDGSSLPLDVHVAIGVNYHRKRLLEWAINVGKTRFNVYHPASIISSSAIIGEGVFVAVNAIIAAESSIADGCIINHAAVVDHNCRIGAYTHIAPNATLGGGVCIGAECIIGAGAIILPGITLGDRVIIAAGAVVTTDIKDDQTAIGIPARCKV